jgi:hypothetical protein
MNDVVTITTNDIEFQKYAPTMYLSQITSVPLYFWPKSSTYIVDLRDEDAPRIIGCSAYPKILNNGVLKDVLRDIITKEMNGKTRLALIDVSIGHMVLDIEHDQPIFYRDSYAQIKNGSDYLVYSGDGRNILNTVYHQVKHTICALNVIVRFNLSRVAPAGLNMLTDLAELITEGDILASSKDEITRFIRALDQSVHVEDACDGYSVSGLLETVGNGGALSDTERPLLLPKGDGVKQGERKVISIGELVGQVDFQGKEGNLVSLEGWESIFPDVQWMCVNGEGTLIVCRNMQGSTTTEDVYTAIGVPRSLVNIIYSTGQMSNI